MSLIRKVNHMGFDFPFFNEKGLFDDENLFENMKKNIENAFIDMSLKDSDKLVNTTFSVYSDDNKEFEELVDMKKRFGDKINVDYNGKPITIKGDDVYYGDDIYIDERFKYNPEIKDPITDMPENVITTTLEDIKPLSYFNKDTLESLVEHVYNNLVKNGVIDKKDDVDVTEVYEEQKTNNPIIEMVCDEDNVINTTPSFEDAYFNNTKKVGNINDQINDFCAEMVPKYKDLNERLEKVDNLHCNAISRKNVNSENKELDIHDFEVSFENFPVFNNSDLKSIRLNDYPRSIEMEVQSKSLKYLKLDNLIEVGDIVVRVFHKNGDVKECVDTLTYKNMVLSGKYHTDSTLNKDYNSPFMFGTELYFTATEDNINCKKPKTDNTDCCMGTCM